MRECSGSPAKRQAENHHLEPGGFPPGFVSFTPIPSPPGRKELVFPGYSPFAAAPGAGGDGVLLGPARFPFSNSSILRPDQKPTLVARLRDNEKDVFWTDFYRMDLVFRRKRTDSGMQEPKGDRPARGKIDHFSKKARLRLKHQVRNANMTIESQFLLTYPADFPKSGRTVKNHLDRLLRALRKAYGADSFGFEWILEFQDRGAPHYHLFLTWPPSNEMRRFIAKRWNRIVKGGKDHLWVHLRPRNFSKWDMGKGNYAMKYAQKMEQKEVPEGFENVGRFWGCSRNMIPVPIREDYFELAELAGNGWSEDSIRLYFQRAMRRYHDTQIRQFGKSSFLGKSGWTRVMVPNASRLWRQLCAWSFGTGPPSGDMKYREPPGGEVPF